MDPDANLAELRRIAARVLAAPSIEEIDCADAERIADLVDALDGWLSRGGFLPDAWKR
jgi:hypothetical protein